MGTVAQLKAELGDISQQLGDGAEMLRTFARRVDQMAQRTNAVMEESLRPDVQGPAVVGLGGVRDGVSEAAVLLSRVQKLLETYANGL